jgi:hypothetical protein
VDADPKVKEESLAFIEFSKGNVFPKRIANQPGTYLAGAVRLK